MSHTDAPMDDILARLTAMQATFDAQQATIAQQQADIAALRQENAHWRQALASDTLHTMPESSDIPAVHDEAHEAAGEAGAKPRGGLTSRRSLLRGAAAATAAASVGAVALGAAQPAHAAPLTDGSALIAGTQNNATLQTTIFDTAGNAQYLLQVWNNTKVNSTANAAICGFAQYDASGVYGQSATGNGIYGYASNYGNAVYGEAPGAWAVVGDTTNGYDLVAATSGIIAVQVQGYVGAPTTGFFFIGDCIRDLNGDLWLCTAGDGTTVGTWVKAAHAIAGLPGGATSYLAKPIRLFDSRPSQPAASNPGHPLQPNSSTKVSVAGVSYNSVTVPSPLAGAIGNVTVLDASGGAFVEIVPSGAGFTGASTANIGGPGQIVANGFNVALAGGALDIYVAGVAVDVIIDLFAVVA